MKCDLKIQTLSLLQAADDTSQAVSPQTSCAQGGLQATRAKQPVPHSWQRSLSIELVWELLRAVQRAQSSPPCWRTALLITSGSSPAQHCEGPNHASVPTESTCAAAMPSRWLPLKSFFCFGEGSCSSRGNSVQMYPKLNNFSLTGLLLLLFT